MLTLILALTLAQPPQYPTRPVKPIDRYHDLARAAIDGKMPFVVFVGCQSRHIRGTITHARDTLNGYKAPCIVVAKEWDDGDGWLYVMGTLPPDADDARILTLASASRKAVSQPAASPFAGSPSSPSSPPSAGRDGSGTVAGLRHIAGHACPSCGRTVLRIAGPGPVPGTHRHACPCGQQWFH